MKKHITQYGIITRAMSNCLLLGSFVTWALAVAHAALPSVQLLPPPVSNAQVTVRINATPGAPFTLETCTNLGAPYWVPLLTTNVPDMPYDIQDFEVKLPQKFYRLQQWRTVVFRDDFDGTGMPNPAFWVVNHPESWWWVLGRSFFPSPSYHPGAPFPRLAGGRCLLEHHLYNSYHLGIPKSTFLGSEIHTLMLFYPTNIYCIEARIRCNSYPNGLVASFFTYSYDGSLSDEIDWEFLSKQSNNNERWPAGDPVMLNTWNESQQCPQYAAGTNLDLTVWNTFRIYWFPGRRIDWTWLAPGGETLMRSETNCCLPDEAISIYFNFWAASAGWIDAYDSALQPAQGPGQNVIHSYEIDYVEVRIP